MLSAGNSVRLTTALYTTEAKEEMTPDSSKSTQEKMKETVTDAKDRLSRSVSKALFPQY